jgi:hypothetical protein
MQDENTLNHIDNYYLYLFVGIIISFFLIYKYDVLNIIFENVENIKNNSSLYLEQKIKERFLQNGILKNTYFPENSIFRKIHDFLGLGYLG